MSIFAPCVSSSTSSARRQCEIPCSASRMDALQIPNVFHPAQTMPERSAFNRLADGQAAVLESERCFAAVLATCRGRRRSDFPDDCGDDFFAWTPWGACVSPRCSASSTGLTSTALRSTCSTSLVPIRRLSCRTRRGGGCAVAADDRLPGWVMPSSVPMSGTMPGSCGAWPKMRTPVSRQLRLEASNWILRRCRELQQAIGRRDPVIHHRKGQVRGADFAALGLQPGECPGGTCLVE